jgi:hypothetical protein
MGRLKRSVGDSQKGGAIQGNIVGYGFRHVGGYEPEGRVLRPEVCQEAAEEQNAGGEELSFHHIYHVSKLVLQENVHLIATLRRKPTGLIFIW